MERNMENVGKNNTTSYDEMLKKKQIAPILKLPEDGPWEIVSEMDGLVMIHYNNEADVSIYGNLRGVVIDMETKTIVCTSYPHAQTIISNNLGEEIMTSDGPVKLDNLEIQIGFEGTLMHVFKWKGKVYRVTRKRLDPSKSRWGNSKKFGEIYAELNGPSDDVLFSQDKEYSPFVHTFILVHPNLLIASKDAVYKGFLVYLGSKQMYDSNGPFPLEKVDTELHCPSTLSQLYDLSGKHLLDGSGKIFHPKTLALGEANKHLLFGYYSDFPGWENMDKRLLPGEFVIAEDKTSGKMYKIESEAYFWRSKLRNNNPNLKHQFFDLLDKTHKTDNTYRDFFLPLILCNYDSLVTTINMEPIVIWSQTGENEIPEYRDNQMYQIWQNFLIVVPLCRQKEVLEFFPFLLEKREEVIIWLQKLSKDLYTGTNPQILETCSKRVKDILTTTRNFAEKNIRNRKNFKKNIEDLTNDNIRNFLYKELGSSLYRLVREMTNV